MNALFSSDSIPLVALHGWGMNAAVWYTLEPFLPPQLPMIAPNLPGYGGTDALDEMSMQANVEWLGEQFNGECHLLGWSMGGLLAQAFCEQYPHRVRSITLVASTPSFVQRDDWMHAVEPDLLQQFDADLTENQKATMRRFIALQFMGESGTAKLQKQLRESLVRQPPSEETLAMGLRWLMESDFRHLLPSLDRQQWILGQLDHLIPAAVSANILALQPNAVVTEFEGCGHAPFLTQPERFTKQLLAFIQQ